MGQHEFPVESLMEACAAQMEAAGITVEHKLGASAKYRHKASPRYVWIPTRALESKAPVVRNVQEHRTLIASALRFEVWCFGRTLAECWALRNNVQKCITDQARADADFIGDDFERPRGAENQHGDLIVTEWALTVPTIDVLIPIDTLEEPDPSTALPARIEGQIFKSPDVHTDGEQLTTVTT